MDDHLAFTPAHKDRPSLYLLHRVTIDELISDVDVLYCLSWLAVRIHEFNSLAAQHNCQEDDLLGAHLESAQVEVEQLLPFEHAAGLVEHSIVS